MKFKNLITCTLLFLMATLFSNNVSAQKVEVSPKPHHITWGSNKAFDNNVSYKLIGAETADADAVNLFKKNFTIADNGVEVVIGEIGDAVIKAQNIAEADITEIAEGYYLQVEKNKVTIAGNDGRGTFYGVQTFIQLASQPEVMEVVVTDYPSISERGLVEGFYGNPYSEADRYDLFEFFGRQKMNVYIYGPKDDIYHKDKWREPYPEAQGKKIADYVAAAKANKVDFIWAIHPGVDIKWNKTDSINIVNKLKKMYDLGVRTFAVFFDDIWGEGTKAENQAALMNYITQELNKAYDDVNPCIICPTQYNKGWTSGNYLNVLGTQMDKSVRIMWTGNSVVDMIEKNDMDWINQQISRKAYIWLNYPVTDYCINHMLMGPTWGNGLNIAQQLGGFTSNPMEYAMASKVSLYSIGDYCWNMENYDADASWESAIAYLMPRNREAFHFFCENNVDLGVNTHGLRRTNESPEFVEVKKVFDSYIEQGDTTAAVAAMRAQMKKFTDTATTLLETDEAPALIEELKPWLQCMKYTGERGEDIMDMFAALIEDSPEKFIDSYLKYKERTDAQDALRSRDFQGTIKWAKPEVATLHVAPFIKSTISSLVTLYKSRYSYRTDVFPAQEIENGTYFIMYNGKYLTNSTPNVDGSKPEFIEKRDDVRPQRQEWRISIDPQTSRYKITNVEDSRYLNELGSFSKSNSTNPYEAVWHTYYILRLADGKYCIQNAGSAGENFWTVSGSRIEKGASKTLEPENFIFDLVPISGADKTPTIESGESYYIMSGNKFLTNESPKGTGGTPRFKEVNEPGAAQEWKIEKDAAGKNNYKITSIADGRYVNEYGDFGVNPYYPDWNTYLILMMDGKFSVETTQSAGVHFWNISADRLEWDNNLTRSSASVIKIVKKGTLTGIKKPEAKKKRVEINNGKICLTECADVISLFSIAGEKLAEARNSNCVDLQGVDNKYYIVVVRDGSYIQTYKILNK